MSSRPLTLSCSGNVSEERSQGGGPRDVTFTSRTNAEKHWRRDWQRWNLTPLLFGEVRVSHVKGGLLSVPNPKRSA